MNLMKNLGIHLLFTVFFAPQAQAMHLLPKVRQAATTIMKHDLKAAFTTQTCTRLTDSSSAPNQTFNHSTKDLKLVPFDLVKHGSQAQKIFREAFGGAPPILFGIAHSEDERKTQVLAYQDNVVGVIVYRDHHRHSTTQRYVRYLCVDSAYRNKNYGTYFMREFEQLTYNQGITEITLVDPLMKALPLYKRLGYQLLANYNMVKKLKPLNQNTPPQA